MRIILKFLAAVAILATSSFQSNAENLTTDQLDMVTVEMKKQLPINASQGIVWTDVFMSDNHSVMNFKFTFDPGQMGVTADDFLSEFDRLPAEQRSILLGKEFNDIAKSFGIKARLLIILPDGRTREVLSR